MQGMRFLVVDQTGPINHGLITQKLTPDRYLVTFARLPQVSRVAALDEIMGWNLFPDDNAMNAFIADLAKKKKQPPSPEGVKQKKKASKKTAKKVAKKKAKKKANGKK